MTFPYHSFDLAKLEQANHKSETRPKTSVASEDQLEAPIDPARVGLGSAT